MGLDMYLQKKTYVKNWDHMQPNDKHAVTVKKGGETRKDIKPERVSYITEEVAYWRKANAIHKWFVDECQGGVDDCRTAYVSRDQLGELVSLCERVLSSVETVPGTLSTGTSYYPDGRVVEHTKPGEVVAQKGLAESLLPTRSGFFFGSTEYDEYYLEDLRNAVRMLKPLLDEDGDGDFYYHSSW